MDIAYLLWLQELRESLPPVVEQFFVIVSAIAVSTLLVIIPCVLYWLVDKRAGQFAVLSFSLGTMLNQLVKNTVCCYRPWIRDAAIHPTEAALPEATGYSFPSGHTQGAVSLVGAVGWYYRRQSKLLVVACAAFALLVAFSRNFLGVHTPQDVAVGLLVGVVAVAAAGPLLSWADAHDGNDARLLAAGLAATAAYLAYVAFKPYPTSVDAAGALLVDPVQMQVDCFKGAGVFAGFLVGWFLERRYLNFEVDPHAGWHTRILRLALGIAVMLLFHEAAKPLLAFGMDERVFELVKNFLTLFAATYVSPLAFCAVERRWAGRNSVA